MASDRARLSADPSRSYRSVVRQQGRVTLEADTNEATLIAETALREDVIDIVGPSGTPDDGYEVTSTGSGFEVGPGTYYLGGWRVTLPEAIPLFGGPDALDDDTPQPQEGNCAIALLLTEQEVSAVEDRALLEVALGGPDTAQRTRLMQRAVAVPTRNSDCMTAAEALAEAVKAEGAEFDPDTAALLPTARLLVTPVAPPTPASPCDPPSAGGYLGADNQLIRVSVSAYDPGTGRGRLVWGYDNASTMYRVSTSDGVVLTLAGEPVDSDHAPHLDQAVEVLRTRARLGAGDVVAADAGLVTHVDQPYDPDLRRVRIDDTIPAGERGDADHPLFLRLWTEEIEFTAGTAVELGETGLAVTVTLDALGGGIVARPYWCFAVRPSTPVIVYPRRYLDAAQPPEGPRQWLASLAVGEVGRERAVVTDDCRETFVPLTKIRPGCCGIMLEPGTGRRDQIQAALNRLRGTRGTVTLRPGVHKLRKPLRLDASHKGLTLEGCGEGVFLEALDEEDPDFAQGLILLDDVNEVHLRDLQFQMPTAEYDPRSINVAGLGRGEGDRKVETLGSVAVAATGCAQLVIERCQFRYRLRDKMGLFAVGLLLRGECWGLRLRQNRFLHDIDYDRSKATSRILIGVALAPALGERAAEALNIRQPQARLDALLDSGDLSDNEFVGLTMAVQLFARLGHIRIERNRVLGCAGGILVADSAAPALLRVYGGSVLPDLSQALVVATMLFAGTVPSAGSSGNVTAAEAKEATQAGLKRSKMLAKLLEQHDSEEFTPLTRALVTIAAMIEAEHEPISGSIHVAHNDVDVFGALRVSKARQQRNDMELLRTLSRDGLANIVVQGRRGQFPALSLAFEYHEDTGVDLLVVANRFASEQDPCVLIRLPRRLVFSSNIVKGADTDDIRALWIDAVPAAKIEVMANVVDRYAGINPHIRPEGPSQDWSFVNRTY